MLKKKRVVFSIVLIVFLAALATGAGLTYDKYFRKSKKTDQAPPVKVKTVGKASVDDAVKKGSSNAPNSAVAAVGATTDAQKSIASKDYTAAIEQAKKAYENTNASTPTRVFALSQCITAARAAGDTGTASDCETKANQLIAAIPANAPSDLKEYCTYLVNVALGKAKISDYGGLDAYH